MYFLDITDDGFGGYSFSFRDLESREDKFVSEEVFSSHEECVTAAQKHELYENSEIKYF